MVKIDFSVLPVVWEVWFYAIPVHSVAGSVPIAVTKQKDRS